MSEQSLLAEEPTSQWRKAFKTPRRWISKLANMMPKGLYPRSLLIIITPVVLLQAVVAYVFMERHWQAVTGRLSAATTKDIAALIELYERLPKGPATKESLERIAIEKLQLSVEFRPPEDLPPVRPKPFFSRS